MALIPASIALPLLALVLLVLAYRDAGRISDLR